MDFEFIETNFNSITSIYDIYHAYQFEKQTFIRLEDFIDLLHKKYEVIHKRKQVKGVKYTKYIILK